jgi:hypothetical protein
MLSNGKTAMDGLTAFSFGGYSGKPALRSESKYRFLTDSFFSGFVFSTVDTEKFGLILRTSEASLLASYIRPAEL